MSNSIKNNDQIRAIKLLCRAIRVKSGLTQPEVARRAGVSAATIAKLEATSRSNRDKQDSERQDHMPREKTLGSILTVCGVSKSDFDSAVQDLLSRGLTHENAREIVKNLPMDTTATESNPLDSNIAEPQSEYANFEDATFFEKLVNFAGQIPFVQDAVAAYFSMRDSSTPLAVKATLASALVYFISPLDVIPDVTPVIGFTDDAALLATAIAVAGSAITKAHRLRAKTFIENLMKK